MEEWSDVYSIFVESASYVGRCQSKRWIENDRRHPIAIHEIWRLHIQLDSRYVRQTISVPLKHAAFFFEQLVDPLELRQSERRLQVAHSVLVCNLGIEKILVVNPTTSMITEKQGSLKN